MNYTLIVLGLGVDISQTGTISAENNSVCIVRHNEIDRAKGLEFKAISFIGLIPDRRAIENQLLPYLR